MIANDYRRRREQRTNYAKRYALLKSRLPRLVVRRSNKRYVVQFVEHNEKGDKIKGMVCSDVLAKKLSLNIKNYKNMAMAYLSGYYLGKKVKSKDAILDIGLHRIHKKGRLFAVAKGFIDSGSKLRVDKDVLPDMDCIKSRMKDFDKVLEKI